MALPPTESVTVAVKGNVPVCVGVPVIEPLLKFSPVGRVPVNCRAPYGGVPPVAESDTEYAAPC